MLRERFIDASCEYENDRCTVTIYNGDEICGRFKMNTIATEEYDDEIILRGDNNDFVILNDENIEEQITEDDKTEFLFGTGDFKIGVEFPS